MYKSNESVFIKHFKENKDTNVDYLLVNKHDMKGKKVVPLYKVLVDKETTLEKVLDNINNDILYNRSEIEQLQKDLEYANQQIYELKLMLENMVKEIIKR